MATILPFTPAPVTEPVPETAAEPGEIDIPVSQKTLLLATIVATAKLIPGCTTEVRGTETDTPVVWLYGVEKRAKEAAKAIGGRWSPTRQAWWITIEHFLAAVPLPDESDPDPASGDTET